MLLATSWTFTRKLFAAINQITGQEGKAARAEPRGGRRTKFFNQAVPPRDETKFPPDPQIREI